MHFFSPTTSEHVNFNRISQPTTLMSTTQAGPYSSRPKGRNKQPVRGSSSAEPPNRGGHLPLRQIEYRTKLAPIKLYHFRKKFLSVYTFRRLIARHYPSYTDTLIGPDTQVDLFRIDGDELPHNVVEVAYLSEVWARLKGARTETFGCALGFRTINKDKENIIEWCCFDRKIEDTILKKWVFEQNTKAVHVRNNVNKNNPKLLFNHVASLDKNPGLKAKQGKKDAWQEHIDWHKSLSMANLRPRKVKFTWNSFPVEYMAHVTQKRQAEAAPDEEVQQELEEEEEEHASDDEEDEEDDGGKEGNQGDWGWAERGYASSDTMDFS